MQAVGCRQGAWVGGGAKERTADGEQEQERAPAVYRAQCSAVPCVWQVLISQHACTSPARPTWLPHRQAHRHQGQQQVQLALRHRGGHPLGEGPGRWRRRPAGGRGLGAGAGGVGCSSIQPDKLQKETDTTMCSAPHHLDSLTCVALRCAAPSPYPPRSSTHPTITRRAARRTSSRWWSTCASGTACSTSTAGTVRSCAEEEGTGGIEA